LEKFILFLVHIDFMKQVSLSLLVKLFFLKNICKIYM